MNSIAINTSQNVNLDFTVASIGDRMAAFIIDWIIKISYIIIIWLVFEYLLPVDAIFAEMDDWSVMAIISIIMLPVALYTLVFESLMEGQTPGKKMMKIKVVKIDGYQASFSDYLIRWFFRLVDIMISSGVVGLLTMIFSPYNQRLGGLASGTAVISTSNHIRIDHTILQEFSDTYQPRFQQVLALTDHDMRIIKDNYQRALRLNEYTVVTRLAEKIREITGIPDLRSTLNDKEFIQIVITDFNYYTGKES